LCMATTPITIIHPEGIQGAGGFEFGDRNPL
jgi:hypothetical protein